VVDQMPIHVESDQPEGAVEGFTPRVVRRAVRLRRRIDIRPERTCARVPSRAPLDVPRIHP
jgi:hypothetical protein